MNLNFARNFGKKITDVFDANSEEDQRKRMAAGQARMYQDQQAQQAQQKAQRQQSIPKYNLENAGNSGRSNASRLWDQVNMFDNNRTYKQAFATDNKSGYQQGRKVVNNFTKPFTETADYGFKTARLGLLNASGAGDTDYANETRKDMNESFDQSFARPIARVSHTIDQVSPIGIARRNAEDNYYNKMIDTTQSANNKRIRELQDRAITGEISWDEVKKETKALNDVTQKMRDEYLKITTKRVADLGGYDKEGKEVSGLRAGAGAAGDFLTLYTLGRNPMSGAGIKTAAANAGTTVTKQALKEIALSSALNVPGQIGQGVGEGLTKEQIAKSVVLSTGLNTALMGGGYLKNARGGVDVSLKQKPTVAAKPGDIDPTDLSKKTTNSFLNKPDEKLNKPNRLQGEGYSYQEAKTGLTQTGKDMEGRIRIGFNDKGEQIVKDGTHLLEAHRELGIPIPKNKVEFEAPPVSRVTPDGSPMPVQKTSSASAIGDVMADMEKRRANPVNIARAQAEEIAAQVGGKVEDVQRNIDRYGYDATNNMYKNKNDGMRYNPDTEQGIKNIDAVVTSELKKQYGDKPVVSTKSSAARMSPEEEASLYGTAPGEVKPVVSQKVPEVVETPTVDPNIPIIKQINDLPNPNEAGSADVVRVSEVLDNTRNALQELEKATTLEERQLWSQEVAQQSRDIKAGIEPQPLSPRSAELQGVIKDTLEVFRTKNKDQMGDITSDGSSYLPEARVGDGGSPIPLGTSFIDDVNANFGFSESRTGAIPIDQLDDPITRLNDYTEQWFSHNYGHLEAAKNPYLAQTLDDPVGYTTRNKEIANSLAQKVDGTAPDLEGGLTDSLRQNYLDSGGKELVTVDAEMPRFSRPQTERQLLRKTGIYKEGGLQRYEEAAG
jgi:hypothetical protein